MDRSTLKSACKKDSKQRQSRETFEANLNEWNSVLVLNIEASSTSARFYNLHHDEIAEIKLSLICSIADLLHEL